MGAEYIILFMFGGLIVLLIMGLPLAFALSGMAILATVLTQGVDSTMFIVYNSFSQAWNEVFIAVPMFVFMGALLEKSGIAEDLFEAMYRWFGPLRGGLAIGVVIICAIFAAMTGVTGAATVTMGLIAVPAMLKRGYDNSIALGTVASAGTLGILIPPSVSMVLIGAIAQLSIGKLFMGGIIPGTILSILLIAYILIRGWLQPEACPACEERYSLKMKILSIRSIILPSVIILAVTGTIMLGLATPTEASAVGAACTFVGILATKNIKWKTIQQCTFQTFTITGMVMWIIFGAVCFTNIIMGTGGLVWIKSQIVRFAAVGLHGWGVIVIILGIIFVLGLFLDPTGIIFIVAPVAFPIMKELGFDPIWFGVIMVMCLQIGYITPPFGFNLFYLKATVPKEITLGDIYRSIWVYVIILVIGVVICLAIPETILWLPAGLIK